MKKFLVLSLFIAQFVIFTASAVEPIVVIDEDFSLFTAGSEENPDGKSITTPSFYVESQYTKIPKWIGYNVHQAGGVCALLEYNHIEVGRGYGYISTPEMELYGETTVTFRARRAHSNPQAGNLDLALCDNTSGRLETTYMTLSNEWQEFSWTTKEAVFNDRCIFQFTPMNGDILLDDIKVVRSRTTLPKLEVYEPENISISEFKAKWEDSKLEGKTGYYFNVFYKDWPDVIVEPGELVVDFESVNLKSDNTSVDTSNPGYPAGWTIDVSSNGTKDACTDEGDYNSGEKAINFDAEGDYILTPEAPAPIHKLSFWIKPSNMTPEDYIFSLVCVEVKAGDEWTVIANIPNYWMTEGGGYYILENDVLGEYVTQIKISCSSMNKVTFAIDDVQIDYATQKVPYPLITDKFVTEAHCIVSDIDPTKEHYYYVKQTDGEVTSEPSKTMWVDALLGLTPEVLPATDVTETSFTANWEVMPNASHYKLFVNQEYETQLNDEEVVLISEDFNSIVKGSIDAPYNPYEDLFNLADNGLCDNDWFMTVPYMAKGMAGSQGPTGTTAGLVVTPRMVLGNNPIIVDFTVYNTQPNEVIWVVIMDDYKASYALYGLSVDCAKAGSYTTEQLVFQNLALDDQPVYIAFMSQSGAFFVDEVKVSTIVPNRGTTVERPYKLFVSEENSCKIDRIRKVAPAYNYYVDARRTKNFIDYVSEPSDKMRVKLYDTSVEGVENDDNVVYVANNLLHIVLSQATRIDVYNIAGVSVATVSGKQGDNTIELNAGIYIVKINDKTYKLIIK